jgi:SAM-dependent methyltransferase
MSLESALERSTMRSRRVAQRALRRLGLTRMAFRALERYRGLSGRRGAISDSEGIPLPPAHLMVKVSGHADGELFLAGGKLGATVLRDTMARAGLSLQQLDAILDFGCGCGRIARHLSGLQGPTLHGCDENAALVQWCRDNLPFVDARVNGQLPPLPYAGETFDLVYAFSVFTHLTERSQRLWMKEMHRVLRPGGHLVFSTHGEAFRGRLASSGEADLLAAFDSGRMVVLNDDAEFTNLCGAFHPYEWVTRELLGKDFEVKDFVTQGAQTVGHQDLWLVVRR